MRYRTYGQDQAGLKQRRNAVEGFGTEMDKTNCSFFIKTGSCRYGESCSKYHPFPITSDTIVFYNMYYGPGMLELVEEGESSSLENQESEVYEAFYKWWEDVIPEVERFGPIKEIRVCRNQSSHLRGNLIVQYEHDFDAKKALEAMHGRFYDGRRLQVLFVVTLNFKSAVCGSYMRGGCDRGAECNFLHVFKNPPGRYDFTKKKNDYKGPRGKEGDDDKFRAPVGRPRGDDRRRDRDDRRDDRHDDRRSDDRRRDDRRDDRRDRDRDDRRDRDRDDRRRDDRDRRRSRSPRRGDRRRSPEPSHKRSRSPEVQRRSRSPSKDEPEAKRARVESPEPKQDQ